MTNVHSNPPPLPPGSLIAIGIAFAVVGLFSTERHLWLYRRKTQSVACIVVASVFQPYLRRSQIFYDTTLPRLYPIEEEER